MKRFPRETSVAKLQMQKMQGMQMISGIQGIPNERNALSGLVAIQPGVNSSMNNNIQVGSQGPLALSNYQSALMKQSMINSNSRQDHSSSFINRSPFQGQPLQNNNGKLLADYQRFPCGIFQVQQNQNQNQNHLHQPSSQVGGNQVIQHPLNQQVMKGMDDNNSGSGAKPSSSGQSGYEPTGSNSFKAGGSGSHSDSCAGGEKAPDLPHLSDIFQDIISEFTENGFFNNDEPGWKA